MDNTENESVPNRTCLTQNAQDYRLSRAGGKPVCPDSRKLDPGSTLRSPRIDDRAPFKQAPLKSAPFFYIQSSHNSPDALHILCVERGIEDHPVDITGPAHLVNFACLLSWRVESGNRYPDKFTVVHTQMSRLALKHLAALTESPTSYLFPESLFFLVHIPEGRKASVENSFRDIANKFGRVDESWLSRLRGASDKVILDLIPHAPVVFFSEGASFWHHKTGVGQIADRITHIAVDLERLIPGEELVAGKALNRIPPRIVNSIHRR